MSCLPSAYEYRGFNFDPIQRWLLSRLVERLVQLGDDSFEIEFADFIEERPASGVDVIDIEQPG